jgi:hypothetical protein
MLLGTFPEPPAGRRAKDLLESFVQHARAEYEANLLQLIHWPRLYPHGRKVSLEHWCVLRGHSHGLEHLLADMSRLAVAPKQVRRTFELFTTAMPEAFARMRADAGLIPWFLERFESHLGVALTHALQAMPEIKGNKSFMEAAQWWREHSNGRSHAK